MSRIIRTVNYDLDILKWNRQIAAPNKANESEYV